MINVAFFDDGPRELYRRRQANLAEALATEFVLVGIGCPAAPIIDYHFLWPSPSPMSTFDHSQFGIACSKLHAILSRDMECSFVSADFSAANVMREGIAVCVRVMPTSLDWPSNPVSPHRREEEC